ncbi:MAG: ATP phosphoribosyltransferase regulatory subunit [Dehalococcoidia bacterium]|nr:MAG: ATP phosphoribosyltransferase regulatory subunit [Dehalococcoidia bacterium]
MENQKCKGMQDLLPGDMLRFRRIEDVFRTCCRNWGYQEVRTPTLEYLHLFTATGTLTPSMLSKVYSFLDWDGWSGERVVLRPDGTIPVARLYIDNLSGQELARLFYVTNIFAFEGTGKENRERWQCGAEFFGGAKSAPDVEIILLAEEVIRRLGIRNVGLQLSHAGLVKALLKELKLSPGEEAKMTNRLLEGNWQALTKAKSTNPEVDRLIAALLGLKGKSSSFLHNLRASFPKASQDFKSSLEDLISITTLLDNLGCSYKIDIAAIQGFEYYTGICFQFLAAGEKIGGGGRYDNLAPLMNGEDIPACGFALYVDPIMKLLPLEKGKKGECGILVKGKELAPEIVETCFTVAESLRDAGHPAELDFTGREESNYRWVVLVSGKEPSPFVLTDCVQGRQRDAASMAEILKVVGEG